MERLQRGEWRIEDTANGFVLTVRPLVGRFMAIPILFVGLFGLVLLSMLAFASPGTFDWWLVLPLAACGTCVAMAVMGAVWLAFGTVVLTVEEDAATLAFRSNLLAATRRLAPEDLRTVAVDGEWVERTYWRGGSTLGAATERGPLTVCMSSGLVTHFGGDLPIETAEEVKSAILARTTSC